MKTITFPRILPQLPPLPKRVKIPLLLLAGALVFALPILNLPILSTPDSDFGSVLFDSAIYALAALGLNIVIGYAGLLDLGYVGFYATGAYTTAVLTTYHAHWPFLLALPVAILVTVVAGVLLGAPTLRVRGDYLAIVTLGFGEIIRLVAVNTDWLGQAQGIQNIPSPPNIGANPNGVFSIPHLNWNTFPPLFDTGNETHVLNFGVIDATPYYWLVLVAILIVLWADIRIKKTRVGRAWEATREDEDAAEIMGVPTFKFKLLAFGMGAAIGGLSGSLFATRIRFISPDSFVIILSELFVAAVIIGGAGNRWGALAGGALIAYLPERFRSFSDWRILVFGLAMMALAVWRPQGLFPPRGPRRIEIETVEENEEGIYV